MNSSRDREEKRDKLSSSSSTRIGSEKGKSNASRSRTGSFTTSFKLESRKSVTAVTDNIRDTYSSSESAIESPKIKDKEIESPVSTPRTPRITPRQGPIYTDSRQQKTPRTPKITDIFKNPSPRAKLKNSPRPDEQVSEMDIIPLKQNEGEELRRLGGTLYASTKNEVEVARAKLDEDMKNPQNVAAPEKLKKINRHITFINEMLMHEGFHLVFGHDLKPITEMTLENLSEEDRKRATFAEVIATETNSYLIAYDRPLGKGGQGSVYMGYDLTTGDKVAVKILESRLHIQNEKTGDMSVDLETKLKTHKGIGKYVASCDSAYGDKTILVLPYVEGVNLENFLYDDKGIKHYIEPGMRLDILIEKIDKLCGHHEAGYLHRDVKPGNYMIHVTEDGIKMTLIDCDNVIPKSEAHKYPKGAGSFAYKAPETFISYEMRSMPDDDKLEEDILYVRMTREGDLQYKVLNINDEIVVGKIKKDQLSTLVPPNVTKNPFDPASFKVENIKVYLPKILEITNQKGHTVAKEYTIASEAFSFAVSMGEVISPHSYLMGRKTVKPRGKEEIKPDEIATLMPDIFGDNDVNPLQSRMDKDELVDGSWLAKSADELAVPLFYFLVNFCDADSVLFKESNNENMIKEYVYQLYIFPKLREIIRNLGQNDPAQRLNKPLREVYAELKALKREFVDVVEAHKLLAESLKLKQQAMTTLEKYGIKKTTQPQTQLKNSKRSIFSDVGSHTKKLEPEIKSLKK